jgi:hypothetical protein
MKSRKKSAQKALQLAFFKPQGKCRIHREIKFLHQPAVVTAQVIISTVQKGKMDQYTFNFDEAGCWGRARCERNVSRLVSHPATNVGSPSFGAQ